jgi:SPOR domain
MLSLSARIGAPVIGFVLGLLVTYGLADAGPGPVPSRILQDALAPRIPIGSRIRFEPIGDAKFAEPPASFGDEFDERLASLEERFMGARPAAKTVETKKAAVTQSGTGMRLTSLERPVSSKSVHSDTDSPKFAAASSGDRFLLEGRPNPRMDSFDDRFAGARAPAKAMDDPKEGAGHISLPEPLWVVQLIGDSSEATALSLFRELQNKHKSLLGSYEPVVVRTTLRPGSEPIWTRVRVELSSRQAAESLCSKLEAAGERCFVQRAPAFLPSDAVSASAKSPT